MAGWSRRRGRRRGTERIGAMAPRRNEEAALVLFSGGQDSTTCLAWALNRFARVETVGFDYGQRHRVELECRIRVLEGMRSIRPAWGDALGDDHMVDLAAIG